MTPIANPETDMNTIRPSEAQSIRESVREKYAEVARGDRASCCGDSCGCGADDPIAGINMIGEAYEGVQGYVAAADLKLGCGVPVEYAGLASGQTVLDLGSGAGLDAFVARSIVGAEGHVLGIDFTPEMVEKARLNAANLGFGNVEFRLGDIEQMPIDPSSVDVVISNCVLNLVPDKTKAFSEIARVLRPGGHFCVSDIVTSGEIPAALRASAEAYAGCVAGAIDIDEYLALIRRAGFREVTLVAQREIEIPETVLRTMAPDLRGGLGKGALLSVTVRGLRPAHAPALRIYDPAMCCSTGVCGEEVDPQLVRFAADLKWLADQGVAVSRFNLAHEPEAFVSEPIVLGEIRAHGTAGLPLVMSGGTVVSRGRYPSRDELAAMAGSNRPAPLAGSEALASPDRPVPIAQDEPILLDLAPAGCGCGTNCC